MGGQKITEARKFSKENGKGMGRKGFENAP